MQANYGPVLAQWAIRSRASTRLPVSSTPSRKSLPTLGLRLTDRWSVLGQMRYDIDDQSRIQDLIQLKYQDECFVLTASYIETFVENPRSIFGLTAP